MVPGMAHEWSAEENIKFPLLHNKSWLMARYMMEGKKVTEIMELAGGASYSAVTNALSQYGIYNPHLRRDAVQITRERLLEVAKSKTALRQVWAELGITRATLGKCCGRVGLSIEDMKNALAEKPPTLRSSREEMAAEKRRQKEELYQHIEDMYVKEHLSIGQIGERLGRDQSGIFRILRNRGVDTSQAKVMRQFTAERRGDTRRVKMRADTRRWPKPFGVLKWVYRADSRGELAAMAHRLATCEQHEHLFAVSPTVGLLHMKDVSRRCLGLPALVEGTLDFELPQENEDE